MKSQIAILYEQANDKCGLRAADGMYLRLQDACCSIAAQWPPCDRLGIVRWSGVWESNMANQEPLGISTS
jgi:hypothetical protein